ncbi:MAG: hypothetical protein JWN90_627 [Parcubacteria group bacterium]|nr:hypothetical protein [Parcubacteria group bacterium]
MNRLIFTSAVIILATAGCHAPRQTEDARSTSVTEAAAAAARCLDWPEQVATHIVPVREAMLAYKGRSTTVHISSQGECEIVMPNTYVGVKTTVGLRERTPVLAFNKKAYLLLAYKANAQGWVFIGVEGDAVIS